MAAICDASGMYDRRRGMMMAKIEDQETALAAVREELRRASSRAMALSEQRKSLKQQSELLHNAIQADERELSRYRARTDADRRELEALTHRLQDLEDRRDGVRGEQLVLEAAVRELTRAVEERQQALKQILDTLAPEPRVQAGAAR